MTTPEKQEERKRPHNFTPGLVLEDGRRFCSVCDWSESTHDTLFSGYPHPQPEKQEEWSKWFDEEYPTTEAKIIGIVASAIQHGQDAPRFGKGSSASHITKKLQSLLSRERERGTIRRRNIYLFFAATIYRLNNPQSKMCVPNMVYEALDKKLALLPDDRSITEQEALELVKGTPASLTNSHQKG